MKKTEGRKSRATVPLKRMESRNNYDNFNKTFMADQWHFGSAVGL
jgi:hypothetical protein